MSDEQYEYQGLQLAPAESSLQGVLFIMDDVSNYGELVSAVGENTEVVLLDSRGNGLAQMVAYLANYQDLAFIEVASHGSSSSISLGSLTLDASNLDSHADLLEQLGSALSDSGDLLLLGCNIAEDDSSTFIADIAALTGADVAASNDVTGVQGDWVLESNVGDIESDNNLWFYDEANPNVNLVDVTGDNSGNILTGSVGDDSITGLGGNDTISALDGNDILYGNLGNDTLYGGGGDDTLSGGDGNDFTYGATGNDLLYGGDGNDGMSGADGDDTLYGGLGNDTPAGSSGNDLIYGGDGNDWVWGGKGNDTLYGDAGTDTITGGSEDDILYGGEGNDTLSGRSDADILYGGDDDDYLRGGGQLDTLYGGAGNDTFGGTVANHNGDTIMDFEVGDVIVVNSTDLTSLNGQTIGSTIDLGSGTLNLGGSVSGILQAVLVNGNTEISIVPNIAPTSADTSKTVYYNGSYSFSSSDFSFSDADVGDTLDHITIVTLPGKGTLKLSGVAVSADDDISLANLGNLTYSSGTDGTGTTSFTFTVSDGVSDSQVANTFNINVIARPTTPAEPEPVVITEEVDGTTVTTTEEEDEDGNTIQTVTVTPISSARVDTDTTTSNADISLHSTGNNGSQVVTTVSLPTGVGITTRSSSTANAQNSVDNLIALIEDSAQDEEDLAEMENSGSSFLAALDDVDNLWVNQVTLTNDGSASSSNTIRISGSSDDSYQEALVIDTRELPAGTILDLNDIEFAVIVGTNVTIRGGEGANIVYAGENAQNIVLGAEDDELHGGAGDDIVGSKGGDDLLYGDSGNDTVVGGVGDDTLNGGIGDDLIQGAQQDNGELIFSLNSEGVITTLYTPNELDLSDSSLESISFSGDWYSQASYVNEGQVYALDTSSSIDSLLQANDQFAFLAVDSTRLKTLAILKKVFDGELYTVAELNEVATSSTTLLEYAEQAVNDWRELTSISESDDIENQVLSLLDTFWRYISITREDIDTGVSFIESGGSWEALLLDIVASNYSNYVLYGGTGIMQLAQATELESSGLQQDVGDDVLYGGAGDDTLVGGHGSDYVDGGDGVDVAVQSRASSDYQLVLTSEGELSLVYQDGGYTEQDTLVDIEQVSFSDSTVDFFASNLSSSELLQLGTLGQLMTGAAPSLEQLNEYQNDGLSLASLASALMQTDAYQTQWESLDDVAFISAIAEQVIDGPFTDNDVSYWVERLSNDLERSDVFVLASGIESYQSEALQNGLLLM
ncbi:DUF4347 domain-containing protein [Marinomonas ostreistagni]|uniref:DUF4347 domain-containing protein n=1 Tax=Marinomonas ostreistagni TaxID=359209 RepID=A0ABS0Z8J6_9GAMM|nr:DUF4347 domain-containing protein [Marinomonas ostreistagni]MBJ7549949.1 DUF4347 domain-containing protein [Marinomonas ostreistagni]